MQLYLTREQAKALIADAQKRMPQEACGVVAGRNLQATEVIPLPNRADDPAHRYHIDDQALAVTLSRLSSERSSLLGFYHSHPAGEPIPSTEDIRHAHYPDAAYIIIGLRGGNPTIAAWQIRRGIVERVDLHIGGSPADAASETMPQAQYIAVITSGILAFIFLIVVALYLLPAPPLLP